MWNGSGLKIDSAATDVVWGRGAYSNKILTSARNGELILWDLNRSGTSKYERKARDHVRSIHCLAYSVVSQNFCTTGSADGDLRVWDMRDLSTSRIRIHHPTGVRAVSISPVSSQPMQAITALDNGSIYRWDLRMGQRGQLDRIPVAHAGPILSLDWAPTMYMPKNEPSSAAPGSSTWIRTGLLDDLGGLGAGGSETWSVHSDVDDGRMGWLASGGMDRTVKVWNLTTTESHISRIPAYTLHTSYPVRRVVWRPSYDCELAVVSNVEFGPANPNPTNDSSTPSPAVTSPYMGASALMSEEAVAAVERMPGGAIGVTTPVRGQLGDPVEIWDVRRGFLAKWTVRGSAAEGGVTDVLFTDSHALWAQHYSGTFSQFDLRQSSKPLDAMPRNAVTWNVEGSVAFVTDKPKRWEVPYDDVKPEKRQSLQDKRVKHKALGDRPYSPISQAIGRYSNREDQEELEAFVKLAQGYMFDSNDRSDLCAHNAEVALEAGKESAAQVWFLLGALLMDIVTPPATNMQTPALSPLPFISPHLPHSTSAPAAIPTTSSSGRGTAAVTSPAPGTISHHSPDRQPSASTSSTGCLSPQRTTPASSTAPSPHRKSTPLPPLPAAIFARRASNAGLPPHPALPSSSIPTARPRLLSSLSSRRKTSFSTSTPSLYSVSMQSESPSEISMKAAGPSLKHIGDGALDDSDDDDDDSGHSAGKDCLDSDDEAHPGGFDENWGNTSLHSIKSEHSSAPPSASTPSRASIPPYLYPTSATSSIHSHPNPSPLSRVAGQQTWTEDEDERPDNEDEDSPSPASSSNSDSDYSGNDEPGSRRSSKSKSSRRARSHKTRSRSSTVASLAVDSHFTAAGNSLTVRLPKLTKQESRSSIRTVTAVNSPHDDESSKGFPHGLSRDDTIRETSTHSSVVIQDDAHSHKPPSSFRQAHKRIRSSLSTEFFIDRETIATPSAYSNEDDLTEAKTPSFAEEAMARELEDQMRNAGWDALRETVELYADQGDVQMCTMLSLVAAEELKISRSRVLRFLEAYIDILVRLRLHVSAAYLRKHAPNDEIRNMTGIETTIYTSCGRCRKPLIRPSSHGPALTTTPTNGTQRANGVKVYIMEKPRGNYAFCNACKAATSKCCICHLPVRALLFKCPVCMHGGHEECYRSYYEQRSMLPIPKTQDYAAVKPPVINPTSSPGSQPSARERRMSKSGEPGSADDSMDTSGTTDGQSEHGTGVQEGSILGRPCAAGCGHFCWAANEKVAPPQSN
ncbi:hypothetical protein EIP91_001007 [Steccherinum ochraceum]|uniref:WDR59/RTC1-like RING zinc finger domain-containing protein n=1 Tax=Steccherinum ochraceum TaxID=92696 RepID=A0A4R0RVF0_9APHY|nr:hypothetical protein EIP91_001007 [Steccherinum ochraceum]